MYTYLVVVQTEGICDGGRNDGVYAGEHGVQDAHAQPVAQLRLQTLSFCKGNYILLDNFSLLFTKSN